MTPRMATIELRVNGRAHVLAVPRDAPLLNILRNDLGLNGPKYGCGLGECGACTVLVDGIEARACVIPVGGVEGLAIGSGRHGIHRAKTAGCRRKREISTGRRSVVSV